MAFPKFYVIVDKATLDARGIRVSCFAGEMARAGVKLLQLRDKTAAPQQVLRDAAAITKAFAGVSDAQLVLNDRPDLARLAGWTGVHVGHKDMPPAAVHKVLPGAFVGLSTHNAEQIQQADASPVAYVAIGPVFATTTKTDAEPVVGLDGVRQARALTRKPLVAIGGITLDNARSVLEAGADCVAVIGGVFVPGERPGRVAERFLELLG
ncbi:MAG: thiamine phosphate synthase [Acidobacteriaceae bacterium]|nr:thiamine phosphate synthase [Acidobacteriaceae bacterium]